MEKTKTAVVTEHIVQDRDGFIKKMWVKVEWDGIFHTFKYQETEDLDKFLEKLAKYKASFIKYEVIEIKSHTISIKN